jgi:hypothetical protein
MLSVHVTRTHNILGESSLARFMDARGGGSGICVCERDPEAKTAARTRDPASHLEMRTVFAYCSMGLSFEWVHVCMRTPSGTLFEYSFLFLFVALGAWHQ